MKLLRTSLILFWLNLQAKFAVPTSTWQAVRPPTSPCAVSPLRLRLSRKHIEVAWLWWLIPRQLHKHIEVYTNTTQPMHITMCSFWTPFKVIEKTQNYTKTNTQTCFSLASPQSTPWSNMCLRSKFTRTQTKPLAPPPSLLQILTTQKIM